MIEGCGPIMAIRQPGCGYQEQKNDCYEGKGGDDEVEVQGRRNSAIIEPAEEHDGKYDEGPLIQALVSAKVGDRVKKEAHGAGVRGLKHGVGKNQIKPDVEGHKWADDMLGLSVLATSGGDGRGNLESIIVTQVKRTPANQHAINAAYAPPLPNEKFQPIYCRRQERCRRQGPRYARGQEPAEGRPFRP